MTKDAPTPADAVKEFWKHLSNGTTVMLGINDADTFSQPMTAFAEEENNALWFFTRDDTGIVGEVMSRNDARMVMMSKDREVYADVRGHIEVARDRSRVEKYWNPMVAAWYPAGKDDPHLTLLRFTPEDGQVWVSTSGVFKLAFEVARANLTKTTPKEGSSHKVDFKGGQHLI